MLRVAFLFVLLTALQSENARAYQYEFFEHATLSARASTLGLGGEVGIPIVASEGKRHLSLRAGANGFRYTTNSTEDNVNYNLAWNLMSAYGLLDWYPWGGSFRFSGGLFLNLNRVDIEARPSAGGFNFGGVAYLSGDVDKVDGEITFNRLSPYFGIGWDWGDAGQRLSFSADIGVLYHGSPTASLSASCGPLLTPLQCSALRSDVEQEEDDLNESLKHLKWYPVAALMSTWRF